MQALNKSKFYLAESTLHVWFINFIHLVIMSVDSTKAQPKISSLKGTGSSKPLNPNDCLTTLPHTIDVIVLQS
jgi:hypothetical protein